MRILITGSTGFIGRNLADLLISENHEILELTRDLDKSFGLFADKTKKLLITSNQDELIEGIEAFKPEIVLHLAAFLSSSDDYITLNKLVETNIVFLSRILDAIKNTSISLFINTGTFAAIKNESNGFNPTYLYAATKEAAKSLIEYYAHTYNFKFTTIRPFTVYGGVDSNKKVIDIIIDSLDIDEQIEMTPGDQILDFVHIDDVVNFYSEIIKHHKLVIHKSELDLGTGVGYSIKELAIKIEQISGKNTNIKWGARPYRKNDILHAVANLDQMQLEFSFNPRIGLEEGLSRYLKCVKMGKIS